MLNIFALAFSLLFVFHDLEEIIGMKRFVIRNADMLQERYPFLYKRLRCFTTEGFALAVMEELVVFSVLALAALYFDNTFCWNMWFGGFLGLTAHFVMHIGQALWIRRYIPALIDINVRYIVLGLLVVALNMIPVLKIAGSVSCNLPKD